MRMRRATAAATRIVSLLSTPLPSLRHIHHHSRPALSPLLRLSPSPPSLPLPRHFRFSAPNSAGTSSPPPSWKTSWKDWEEIYAIANNCTLAHTSAIAQLWLVWHKWYKILTSYPFSLYSGHLFRSSGSRKFAVDVEDLEDSAELGFMDFVEDADAMDHKALTCTASACLAFARDHPNVLWKDIEVVVENGSPFLFKDAAETVARMKLYVDASTPDDVLGSDKPSTVDLMKFLLSYASVPLFSPVVYYKFSAERVPFDNKELVEESVGRLLGEMAKIVVPQKVSSS